jgi:hypothetical protein
LNTIASAQSVLLQSQPFSIQFEVGVFKIKSTNEYDLLVHYKNVNAANSVTLVARGKGYTYKHNETNTVFASYPKSFVGSNTTFTMTVQAGDMEMIWLRKSPGQVAINSLLLQ